MASKKSNLSKSKKENKVKNGKVKKTKDKSFFNKSNKITKNKIKLQNTLNVERSASFRKNQGIRNDSKSLSPSSKLETNFKTQLSDEEKIDIDSRTVFIGNLPKSISRKKLKKLFNKYGAVESARLRCSALNSSNIPRAIAVDKKNFHPKATSVIGFVKFVDKDSVEVALKDNGLVYEDHHLRIDRVGKDCDKTDNIQNSVFIGNLPFDISDNDVRKHFIDCGKIESVHVIRDGLNGVGKGFGYVNFKTPSSVELALKLNDSLLIKRNIRVKRAVKRFAEKRLNEKKMNNDSQEKVLHNQSYDDKLKSDKEIVRFRPKRPKKEKKKKLKSEFDFQGRLANEVKKKKSKKKLKKELQKKKFIDILNK